MNDICVCFFAAILVQVISRDDQDGGSSRGRGPPSTYDDDEDDMDDEDDDMDDEDDDVSAGDDGWVRFGVAVQAVFKRGRESRLRRGPSYLWVRAADLACRCPRIRLNK